MPSGCASSSTRPSSPRTPSSPVRGVFVSLGRIGSHIHETSDLEKMLRFVLSLGRQWYTTFRVSKETLGHESRDKCENMTDLLIIMLAFLCAMWRACGPVSLFIFRLLMPAAYTSPSRRENKKQKSWPNVHIRMSEFRQQKLGSVIKCIFARLQVISFSFEIDWTTCRTSLACFDEATCARLHVHFFSNLSEGFISTSERSLHRSSSTIGRVL